MARESERRSSKRNVRNSVLALNRAISPVPGLHMCLVVVLHFAVLATLIVVVDVVLSFPSWFSTCGILCTSEVIPLVY